MKTGFYLIKLHEVETYEKEQQAILAVAFVRLTDSVVRATRHCWFCPIFIAMTTNCMSTNPESGFLMSCGLM